MIVQHRIRNAFVPECAEGIGRIGVNPSGSATTGAAPTATQPGHADSGVGAHKAASSAALIG